MQQDTQKQIGNNNNNQAKLNYQQALQHFQSMSYNRQYQYCQNNQPLLEHGLGIYFFIQFIKYVAILFFVLAIISIIPIIFNIAGTTFDNKNISLSKTSIGNINISQYTFIQKKHIIYGITIPDFISTLIFLIFIIYWIYFTKSKIRKYFNDPDCFDPRKFTIQVEGFSQKQVNNQQLKKHFDRLNWPCYQANVIYDYDSKLLQFRQLQNIENRINSQRKRIQQLNLQNKQDLYKLFALKQILQCKLYTRQDIKRKALRAYIHFQHSMSKQVMIQMYQRYHLSNSMTNCFYRIFCRLFRHKLPKEHHWHNQQLSIVQINPPHPQQIYWQNLDISFSSRILRGFLVSFLILVLLILSSFILFILNFYSNIPQQNKDCLNIYNKSQLDQQGIQFFIGLVIGIINKILNCIIKRLIVLIRPQSKSLTTRMNIVFLLITQFLNTICIPLLINANILGVKPLQYFKILRLDQKCIFFHNDFNANWYYYVGSIYINFMIFSIIDPILQLIIYKISQKYYYYISTKQNTQITQQQLNQMVASYQIDISDHLTQILLLIFLSMTFSSGIPLLNTICFFSLFIRYLIIKYLIYYCSIRVKSINETVNNWVVKILPLALLLHIFIGIYMYTAPQIFPKQFFQVFNTVDVIKQNLTVNRYLYLPYFIALLGLILLFLILRIISFTIGCIKDTCCPQTIAQVQVKGVQYRDRVKGHLGIHSYDMLKNQQYNQCGKNIIRLAQGVNKQYNKDEI